MDDPAAAVRVAGLAETLVTVRDVTVAGASVQVRTREGDATLPELLRAAEARGLRVATAEIARPTLDDVFLGLTGRSLRETAAA
jgi:ABC-2 type transport system ATP-binding protein